MLEMYSEVFRTARKSHYCHICGTEIKAGEKYFDEIGKCDGDFFKRCTCEPCYYFRGEFLDECDDDEYNSSEIIDYIQEKICYKCSKYGECDLYMNQCSMIRKV